MKYAIFVLCFVWLSFIFWSVYASITNDFARNKACDDYCQPTATMACVSKSTRFFHPSYVDALAVCDKSKDGERIKRITTP